MEIWLGLGLLCRTRRSPLFFVFSRLLVVCASFGLLRGRLFLSMSHTFFLGGAPARPPARSKETREPRRSRTAQAVKHEGHKKIRRTQKKIVAVPPIIWYHPRWRRPTPSSSASVVDGMTNDDDTESTGRVRTTLRLRVTSVSSPS
jgi:hypothetical protein